MTAPLQTDPLPGLIAARITGIDTAGKDGPFLSYEATASKDGREITIDVTRYDFTITGERKVRVVAHLSPQMPIDCPSAPGSGPPVNNGAVDPVIATPQGGEAA